MNETQNPQETAPTQPINQSQETTSQPPPPNQPIIETKKTKSTPTIILSILLTISLGIGGYFAYMYFQIQNQPQTDIQPPTTSTDTTQPTSTPDPTLDWKTFQNENFSYSLSYPNSWDNQGLNHLL
ncbi:hypothetical protein ACFL1M_03165 [Patescibacteria group bacterium]